MYDPTTGRWLSRDPITFAGGDAHLYRYVGNQPTLFTDPSGLQIGNPWTWGGPYHLPTDPFNKWTPSQFFGWNPPLIDQTGWGCGGLAAWRAGVQMTPTNLSGRRGQYNPQDIPDIPGIKQYGTFPEAEAGLAALGGKGLILLVDNPLQDWINAPGAGNFATYWPDGKYWEWANWGDQKPGRLIKHSPKMPISHKCQTFYVVPGSARTY